MFTENSSKVAKKFNCEKCNYKCSKTSDWKKHISTRKHSIMYPSLPFCLPDCLPDRTKITEKINSCQCGKEYKHKQSLYVHRKSCNLNEKIITDCNSDIKQLTTVILQIVTNNDEFKKIILEQNKQIMELSKTQIGNNNINSHKKFNINLFLNEKCKDALNISDFVSQLNIDVKDLEETGRLGFAEGITRIFIDGLNQLDIYNKPIYCNNSKREVFYIKDSDKWTKEEDDKPILTKAIKEVASNNIKQIFELHKKNSKHDDSILQQNNKYLQIVFGTNAGFSKEEIEKNYNKIISNLATETVIPEIDK